MEKNKIIVIIEKAVEDARNKWDSHEAESDGISEHANSIMELNDDGRGLRGVAYYSYLDQKGEYQHSKVDASYVGEMIGHLKTEVEKFTKLAKEMLNQPT